MASTFHIKETLLLVPEEAPFNYHKRFSVDSSTFTRTENKVRFLNHRGFCINILQRTSLHTTRKTSEDSLCNLQPIDRSGDNPTRVTSALSSGV